MTKKQQKESLEDMYIDAMSHNLSKQMKKDRFQRYHTTKRARPLGDSKHSSASKAENISLPSTFHRQSTVVKSRPTRRQTKRQFDKGADEPIPDELVLFTDPGEHSLPIFEKINQIRIEELPLIDGDNDEINCTADISNDSELQVKQLPQIGHKGRVEVRAFYREEEEKQSQNGDIKVDVSLPEIQIARRSPAAPRKVIKFQPINIEPPRPDSSLPDQTFSTDKSYSR